MTYRELVYMCLDEIKLASDDSYITEDHILFLISKYRAFLLRQKYEKTNMPAPISNYQLLNITDLTKGIPLPMNIAIPRVVVTLSDNSDKKATFVSPHRFEFVGENKSLQSFIYCTLDKNNIMQFKNLPTSSSITSYDIYALFEDCVKASEFNSPVDILDEECPIESELVSAVQELVVKDALGIAYRPKDFLNNANDDLGNIGLANSTSKNTK